MGNIQKLLYLYKMFERRLKDVWKTLLSDVRIMMFYGRHEKVNLTCSIKFITITVLKNSFSVTPGSNTKHITVVIFDPIHRMCCVKYLNVSCCLFLTL